ncbi:hypothetical protein ABN034_12230 [Actinopolymorpha sp. B11F2]|uniref:hypothetical protein n=1 Tax=Actinopolymorpha sp. B11F2 TaxID=3160862 RepID=UPI0032E43506
MTDERRRSILAEVARGNLTTDEAELHLAALDDTEPTVAEPTVAEPTVAEPTIPLPTVAQPADAQPTHASSAHVPSAEGSQDEWPALTVRGQLSGGGMVEIAGDTTATEARMEGPNNCTVRHNGSLTEVSGQVGDEGILVVPANADLDIEVNSGEARLIGLRGVLRTRLNVGDAVVKCALTRGHSTIDANAGDLRIVLFPESDVRVVVRCAADIGVDQRLHKVGRGEWTLGEGTARLEVTGNLGSVAIGTER